jgi:hypothetical protein
VTEYNKNKLKNIPLVEFQPVCLASMRFICATGLQKIFQSLSAASDHKHLIACCTRLVSSMELIRKCTDKCYGIIYSDSVTTSFFKA